MRASAMCPCCGFDEDEEYTLDEGDICPACGFENGFDDIEIHRALWIAKDCTWWSTRKPRPASWSSANYLENVTYDDVAAERTDG